MTRTARTLALLLAGWLVPLSVDAAPREIAPALSPAAVTRAVARTLQQTNGAPAQRASTGPRDAPWDGLAKGAALGAAVGAGTAAVLLVATGGSDDTRGVVMRFTIPSAIAGAVAGLLVDAVH